MYKYKFVGFVPHLHQFVTNMLKEGFLLLTLSVLVLQTSTLHIHNPFKHIHNPFKHAHIRQTLDHLKDAVKNSLNHARAAAESLKNHIREMGEKALKDALVRLESIFKAYLLNVLGIEKILGPALKVVQCAKQLEQQLRSLQPQLVKELEALVNLQINKILADLEKGLTSEKDVEAILAALEKVWDAKSDKNDDALQGMIDHHSTLPGSIDSAATKALQNAQVALNSLMQQVLGKVTVGGNQGQRILDLMKNCAKIV